MTTEYLVNRSSTQALNYKSPEEMWSGSKPDLSHMKYLVVMQWLKYLKRKIRNGTQNHKNLFLLVTVNTVKNMDCLILKQKLPRA